VGHTDSTVLKGDGRILDPLVGRFNMGSGHGFCAVVSGFFPEIEVAHFARFSRLELA
jgi:hypothetical protein